MKRIKEFKEKRILNTLRFFKNCGSSSVVERQPSKLRVAGSNPVSRSMTISLRVFQRKIINFTYKITAHIEEPSISDYSHVTLDMCPCSSVGRAHPW